MLPHAYYRKVLAHFGGDNAKAWAWFNQWQPNLGGVPMNMIKKGKTKRLMDYIDNKMGGRYV